VTILREVIYKRYVPHTMEVTDEKHSSLKEKNVGKIKTTEGESLTRQ
jgi:hypothetical protein